MKETPLANCERNFITQAIKQNQRLDGRKNDEFRDVSINFGNDWGSVLVSLGGTKVLGQVSCELSQPKAVRPNEGTMFINVELGPMAAPHLEAFRNTDLNVQISRTLERTFKDSRCVDLESLCVVAEEHVWTLRVDLNVLNHEGNLIDCCSIAALCSLAHFKRPDVSIIEGEVHIHTAAEKEPIPMVLHHHPVCVSYCTFDDGRLAVADPTHLEERTAESSMVFGLNSFRELCCLNLGGTTLTSCTLLLQCAKRAAHRAKLVVDQVKSNLAEDAERREKGDSVGFATSMDLNLISGPAEKRLALRLRGFSFQDIKEPPQAVAMEQDAAEETEASKSNEKSETATSTASKAAQSNRKGKKSPKTTKPSDNQWIPEPEEAPEDSNLVVLDSENEMSDDEEMVSNQKPQPVKNSNVGSDSEEEEKVVI